MNKRKSSGDRKPTLGTELAGDSRYRNLADNALIVIADVSVNGEIAYANRAAVRMFEIDSLDELQKKNVIEFWRYPEQREGFVSRLRRDGYVNNYEIDYLTKKGKVVHALGSAILDGDMISMVVIDITQRKKDEAEKAKLYHDIGERHKELQCLHTITDSIRTKESLGEIFQITASAIPPAWQYPDITQARLRFDDNEWVSEPFEATEWKQSSDIVIDGQIRGNIEVYYLEERPTLDEGPFVAEECYLLDDITRTLSETLERRLAEKDKRDTWALFDSFLSVAPVGTAIFDTHARYVNINEQLANINGASVDDHLGKLPSQMLPGKLGKQSDELIQEILRTNQHVINEEISGETIGQPGVTRYWLRSFFPLQGANQQAQGVGAVVIEITESKKIEEQLRQSQKMEALGTLSGGIAHDFNNLLYPITLNANLLAESRKKDSEEFALLDDIIKSSDKAKDLVSQILLFSRRGEKVEGTCDFTSVVKEALGLVRPALSNSIEIEQDIEGVTAPLACEATQVFQVLVNLITNAAQAIKDAGVIKIALTTEELDDLECFDGSLLHGSFARCTISDNGVGMDEETSAKMFDPFFTTRETEHGTGLGLSTVLGIVRGHGGGICVSSRLGTGTTIEVLLPLADEFADKPQVTTISDQTSKNPENVLFVDDVESIRRSAEICLKRAGYNVTTASSGQQALDVFLTNPDHFDLLVTDQSMGNMSGEKLSIEILRLRPGMPIVICTGHSDAISPESSAKIGIRAYLEKPASPQELRQVVREVLDQEEPG